MLRHEKICRALDQSGGGLTTKRPVKDTEGGNTPKRGRYTTSTEEDEIPEDVANQIEQDGTEVTYRANWRAIRDYVHHHRVQSVYNIRMRSMTAPQLDDVVRERLARLLSEQSHAFKINASYGFILQHRLTGELRYYHSSYNNARLWETPVHVRQSSDFQVVLDRLDDDNIMEFASQMRPDSAWTVFAVTNLSLFVNHTQFLIRHSEAPDLIKNRTGVIAVTSKNNLCFFNCLVLHLEPERLQAYHLHNCTLWTQRPAVKLFKQQYPDDRPEDFRGVTLEDLGRLEDTFKVGVQVYSLQQINEQFIASLIRRPTPTLENIMYIDLSEKDGVKHFSYIYDLEAYAMSFACTSCGQQWPSRWSCERHNATCDRIVEPVYPSGTYETTKTVFDQLEAVNIIVPKELRYYPYRTCFDFECYFIESDKYIAKHVPVSFSVCSNIPGFEAPDFYSNRDQNALIQSFMSILNRHSKAAQDLLLPKYRDYMNKLEALSKKLNDKRQAQNKEIVPNFFDELLDQLEKWTQRMPVLGFNSQRYDINAILQPLMTLLKKTTISNQNDADFIIKANNAFKTICTRNLVFLDITNYLSPGSSYSSYLKAFHVPEAKGFFCYEYVTSFDRLLEPELPPYEAFYSKLNGNNPLECAVVDGKTVDDPETGRQNYEYLQRVWRDHDMTSLMDLLEWYNNLDVKGFVQAADKQFNFFKNHLGFDMFKQAFTLPGLSLQYACANTSDKFHMFGGQFADVHKLLRANIVGGPSIVFHRYHEAGITKIKSRELGQDARDVRSIQGLDANALYLYASGQKMPTGEFIVRRAPDFKKEDCSKPFSRVSIDWMEEQAKQRNIKILHGENGHEIKLGPRKISADGFCPETQEVFQYHGCFWHGCETCFADVLDDPHPKKEGTFREAREKTREITQYFSSLGYIVVEQWACQDKKRKRRPLSSYLAKNPKEAAIVEAVRTGKLFGFVECSISTPDHLKPKFSEFPPVFKNAQISREDVGDFMRAYCEESGALKRPSRLLISSYSAEKVVLITPLLKYYLELGLEVTDISLVVEYPTARACFAGFADKVTKARREGDQSKDNDILAQCFKLVGNSAYGKSIEDVSRHTEVHFADPVIACSLINKKRFKKLTKYDEDDTLFQVELKKKNIYHRLPIHFGFFVYGYAKLRMLEFQYDFVQKYLPYDSYELVEMDTDSSYFALAHEKLEDAIKPALRQDYFERQHEWFPAESCEKHRQLFVDTKMRGETWDPAQCCKMASKYHSRTPGLFKTEFQGRGIVALCSKTYICYSEDDVKISSKGLQKKRNIKNLTRERYLDVLNTQVSGSGTNKGFRPVGGNMHTYEQTRRGLSYLYAKRKVLADGVSTLPLDI